MSVDSMTNPVSVDSLKAWLVGWLAEALAMEARDVELERSFLSYGLDSVQAMSMVGDLEVTFGDRLPPTLAWDYPSVEAMAGHLAQRLGGRPAPADPRTTAESTAAPSEIADVLAGIDDLGEEEIDRLLAKYGEG